MKRLVFCGRYLQPLFGQFKVYLHIIFTNKKNNIMQTAVNSFFSFIWYHSNIYIYSTK